MPPYQMRVINEESELSGKIKKLREFFGTETFWALPEIERSDLTEQYKFMVCYAMVLQSRINRFQK